MERTLKWTWGKYNGFFKDNSVESFTESWTYVDERDKSYMAMMERWAELMKAGYMPEKIEGGAEDGVEVHA